MILIIIYAKLPPLLIINHNIQCSLKRRQPKGILLFLQMIAIFMFNDEALNQFLNEDLLIISIITIVPPIIHGTITYSIINNIIYFDTTTHILISTAILNILRLGVG